MAQRSARRGRKNQSIAERYQAREADVDPIRELPYGPAAWMLHDQAGQMTASDYVPFAEFYHLHLQGRPQMLYLVLNHAADEWKRPPREWFEAKTQFAVIFGERFTV